MLIGHHENTVQFEFKFSNASGVALSWDIFDFRNASHRPLNLYFSAFMR